MLYKLESFGKIQGYSISWDKLIKIIDNIYPEEKLNNGWYRKWEANVWIKNEKSRIYLNLKYYRNFKLRKQKSLGYYDNINEKYIITDHYKTIIDAIAEFQKINLKKEGTQQ